MGVARRLKAERTVTAPDGRVWKIRRRWKLRLRWRQPDVPDTSALFDLADIFVGFTAVVLVFVALALVVVFLLPLLLLVVEAVALVVWVVVLGRSWVVEAATEGPPPEALRLEASGWRGSLRAVEDAAEALEHGERPR